MTTPTSNVRMVTTPNADASSLMFSQRLFALKQRLADHQRNNARAKQYTVANKLTTLRHQAAKAGHSGICIAATRLIGQVHRRLSPGAPDTAA